MRCRHGWLSTWELNQYDELFIARKCSRRSCRLTKGGRPSMNWCQRLPKRIYVGWYALKIVPTRKDFLFAVLKNGVCSNSWAVGLKHGEEETKCYTCFVTPFARVLCETHFNHVLEGLGIFERATIAVQSRGSIVQTEETSSK